MMHKLLIFLILLGHAEFVWSYGEDNPFYTSNPHGTVGDIGTLYLVEPGIYVRPMNNDFLGGTDKLLTGSLSTGWIQRFSRTANTLQVHWRFLTPVYQSAFGKPQLSVPIGRFADWGEIKNGYLFRSSLDPRFMHEFSLGIGHVGNKGARAVHILVHRLTKNSIKNLSYDGQKEGLTLSGGYELGFLPDFALKLWGLRWVHRYGLGIHYNNVMFETYARSNYVCVIHRWLQIAGEVGLAIQHLSHTYDDPSPLRAEIAGGIRYFGYFQTNVKYVSPYLNGDDDGQTYIEALSFNIPL